MSVAPGQSFVFTCTNSCCSRNSYVPNYPNYNDARHARDIASILDILVDHLKAFCQDIVFENLSLLQLVSEIFLKYLASSP